MKTKAILHAHARRRARERYQLMFSKTMRRQMEADIAFHHRGGEQKHVRRRHDYTPDPQRARMVERQSMNRSVWAVEYEGKTYEVVYDRKRKAIVTFLLRAEEYMVPTTDSDTDQVALSST